MKIKWILTASLLGNGVLVFVWLNAPVQPKAIAQPEAQAATAPPAPMPEPSVIPPPRSFRWSEVESTNYVEYVANLRSIGCPEATIRDIIAGDVRDALGTAGSAPSSAAGGEWQRWQQNPAALVDYIVKARPANSSAPITMAADNSHGARVGSRAFGQNSEPAGIEETPITGEMPITGDSANQAPSAVVDRQKMRLAILQATWASDFIRNRYGSDTLSAWAKAAQAEGRSLPQFLEVRGVPAPVVSSQ